MVEQLITLLSLIASCTVCVRLLTYRREPGACHRRIASWCAWVLVACTGGNALTIVLHGQAAHASVWHLGILLVLAFLSCRARGNVSRILRVD